MLETIVTIKLSAQEYETIKQELEYAEAKLTKRYTHSQTSRGPEHSATLRLNVRLNRLNEILVRL